VSEGTVNTTGSPLDGRVAIVTGASRGIGAATACALSAAGAKVVLAARDEQSLHALAEDITGRGGTAIVVPTDVGYAESVCRLVELTLGAYGRLDIAVNNAADNGHRPTPLADVPVGDFDRAIAVSLRGVFLAMKYEIPAMLRGGGGAIVNMSSTAGRRPVGGLVGYVTAKSALDGLTRTAALDYAAAGVRVNALAPGPVLTENLHRAGADAQRSVAASVPVRRLGRPEDVAAAAVWLCGPDAEFVTGTTLTVDGGLLAGMPPFARPIEEQR
jgi:NAD(P)-dependent dehydrogenase (short-subunit alcohol dehydrogenase family)